MLILGSKKRQKKLVLVVLSKRGTPSRRMMASGPGIGGLLLAGGPPFVRSAFE
jgi:hypothetical protein